MTENSKTKDENKKYKYFQIFGKQNLFEYVN